MSKLLHPIRDQVIISLCTVWDSEKVEDEVNYALEIFKTDYIDLYRFVLTGNIKENEKRLSALLKLKREGKIRAVGAAVHVPSQTLSALKKYPEKLDFLMIPISYCFPRAISEGEPIAEQIRKYEIGVIAMKPLCGEYEQGGSHLLRIKPSSLFKTSTNLSGTSRIIFHISKNFKFFNRKRKMIPHNLVSYFNNA